MVEWVDPSAYGTHTISYRSNQSYSISFFWVSCIVKYGSARNLIYLIPLSEKATALTQPE